jgi:hypothetical protein
MGINVRVSMALGDHERIPECDKISSNTRYTSLLFFHTRSATIHGGILLGTHSCFVNAGLRTFHSRSANPHIISRISGGKSPIGKTSRVILLVSLNIDDCSSRPFHQDFVPQTRVKDRVVSGSQKPIFWAPEALGRK